MKIDSTKNILLLSLAFIISLLFLFPIISVIATSFKSSQEIYQSTFTLLPKSLSLANYFNAISKINFFACLSNTLYIVVCNIIGVIFASSLAAYSFAVLEWKGRDLFFVITLATIMLPDMVLAVPQFLLFKSLNWYGTLLPLIIPYFCGLPFYIFLLRQFFAAIPKDLANSARIDGASELRIWSEIYMPLSKPVLWIIVLFQFLISWNDLLKPSIFIIDDKDFTLSLALQQFQSKLGGASWGELMALVVIMLLPVLLIFGFAQKYLTRGINMSGLKEN